MILDIENAILLKKYPTKKLLNQSFLVLKKMKVYLNLNVLVYILLNMLPATVLCMYTGWPPKKRPANVDETLLIS